MKIKEAKKECGCRSPEAALPSLPSTQQRYRQEKEKDKRQEKRPVTKEKKPKQDSKVKKFFKKILNFPEEKSAVVVKGLTSRQKIQLRRQGSFTYKGWDYTLVEAEEKDEVEAELDVSLVLDFTDDVPEQVDKAFNLPPDEIVFVHLDDADFPFENAEDLIVKALGQLAKDEEEELDNAALKQAADYVETEIRWNLVPAGTDEEVYTLLDVPEDGIGVELDEIDFPLTSLEELQNQLLEKQGLQEEENNDEA